MPRLELALRARVRCCRQGGQSESVAHRVVARRAVGSLCIIRTWRRDGRRRRRRRRRVGAGHRGGSAGGHFRRRLSRAGTRWTATSMGAQTVRSERGAGVAVYPAGTVSVRGRTAGARPSGARIGGATARSVAATFGGRGCCIHRPAERVHCARRRHGLAGHGGPGRPGGRWRCIPARLLRGKGVRGDEDGGSRFETVEGSLEQRVADASAETASVQRWIGTPVTPESFAVWRGEFERFLQEQGIAEDVYGTDAAQRSSLKPTGRELFQQHSELFQNDAEGDEEPESATAADALVHSECDIDRSLFAP
eukprot:ctg_1424.g433